MTLHKVQLVVVGPVRPERLLRQVEDADALEVGSMGELEMAVEGVRLGWRLADVAGILGNSAEVAGFDFATLEGVAGEVAVYLVPHPLFEVRLSL